VLQTIPPSDLAILPTNILESFLTPCGINMPGFAVPVEYELVIESARLEVLE
jgi:hypothetical protein